MARVPYRTREAAAGEDQQLYDRLEAERRRPTPNIFLALAHAPVQLDGMLTYAKALRSAGELGPRLRELVILSLAFAKGGDYIAAHHIADAIKAGFTQAQVEALRRGDESDVFDEVEIAVIRLGRAAGADEEITDEHWAAVAAHLDHEQLVQLVLTATWYVSGVLMMRMLGIDLEDDYKDR